MQTAEITNEISGTDDRTRPEMTERDAIERAQNGDAAGFEFLYQSHSRRIYHLCLRMVGNAAEAEELSQDAFLQVFRKIHTFRGESAFSTWLHRLTVNIALMRLRKRRLNEISLDADPEESESDRPPREFGAPDLELTGTVDRVCLDRAIAMLPAGCRQVFMLHDVLGCEHHEIAEKMGYSIGNSKSQLHKARMRLRKLLNVGSRGNARNNVISIERGA